MNVHYLQIVDSSNKLSPLQKKCMESVKARVGENDTYETITVQHTDDTRKLIHDVDVIKMSKAAEIPNLCLVDTDCFLSESFTLDDCQGNRPIFGEFSFVETGSRPDIFLFFVNNCCDYFKQHLPVSKLNNRQYSFEPGVFQNLQGYALFPSLSYVHTYTSMREMILNDEILNVHKAYENTALELTALRKHIECAAISIQTFKKLNNKQ